MDRICGLTSQEAQEQLHQEIHEFGSRAVRIKWLREIVSRPPYILLSTLLTVIAIFLLLLDFCFGERDGTVLFQVVLLVLLTVVNLVLFCWEVFILRTRRIRRLLSKITHLRDLQCPWTPASYPTKTITTLRGSFTVQAYRDGTLVNLPTSLLVRGDVIQLYHGIPTPAKVTVFEEEGGKNEPLHLELGEVPPSELFQTSTHPTPEGTNEIVFAPEATALKLVVTETPIISLLESTIGRKRSKTFLTIEKDQAVLILMLLTITLLPISALINASRWLALDDDLGEVWPEVLLRLQAYTILPLLHTPLPLLWTFINLYGTTRVIALVNDSPDALTRRTGIRRITSMWTTLKNIVKLLVHPAVYPNYRVFHILGSLTSFCSVDKEYVLTSGYPTPEKVFFLRCTKPHEDAVNARENRRTDMTEERGTSNITPGEAQRSSPVEVDEQQSSGDGQNGTTEDRNHGNCGESTPVLESVESHRRETSSIVSTISDLEVVTEILDISPNPESFSGLCFDEVDWEMHIGSLKPIGVNALASSHLLSDPYLWSPEGTTEDLRRYMRNTNCICPLGVEIGVTEYARRQFVEEVLLCSFGNVPRAVHGSTITRNTSALFLRSVQSVQPHVFSVVLRDHNNSENRLLMSRGSGDMISSCCSDFWDGTDLQPMTEMERSAILDFFNRRSLVSYCIALAYNPLLEINMASLGRKERIGIFLPEGQMRRGSEMSVVMADSTNGGSSDGRLLADVDSSYSAEQTFSYVQCNQVFLGMLSLQFRPQRDVIALIEELETAGIRFIHFTAENEVRGKTFAEKLGLEAGWNCHISLGAPSDENSLSSEADDQDIESSTGTSATSSLSSVINAYQSYIRAKLPKGIQNVRPHIANVDNVPLLVPLFTDCTTQAIREMIEVMQENGEVVMCTGNAWNRDNLTIFSQADISLSVIPDNVEQPKCPGVGGASLQSSMSDHRSPSFGQLMVWPTPLEMASHLNSTACQLSFKRDSEISVIALVTESRHTLSCARRGLLFALGSLLSLSLLMLLSSLFLLPPPLSGSHLFWYLFFIVPAFTLSLLSTPWDPNLKSQMPNRKKHTWDGKWLFLLHFFVTFGPTVLISLLLFGLTLGEICSEQSYSDCHPLRGDRNLSDESPWNGWRGDHEQGLLFAQELSALFFTIYLVALSVRFVHRTEPIWRLWKFVSWQYIVTSSGAIILQITYFAIAQAMAVGLYDLSEVADLSSVPSYVWVLALLWPFGLVPIQEVLKYYDRKMVRRNQRHLRLEFETKLGMNSPF